MQGFSLRYGQRFMWFEEDVDGMEDAFDVVLRTCWLHSLDLGRRKGHCPKDPIEPKAKAADPAKGAHRRGTVGAAAAISTRQKGARMPPAEPDGSASASRNFSVPGRV
eukprot:5276246-Amphidinium_carterae.1